MVCDYLSLFRNAAEIYEHLCRPVCRRFNIQQTGLDILVFLSHNPERNTAVDIQRSRGIKQSMVSFHVDKLVNDGYIERQSVEGDRRKIRLVCTPAAAPIIEAGVKVIADYMNILSAGISEGDRETARRIMSRIGDNIAEYREQIKKGEHTDAGT